MQPLFGNENRRAINLGGTVSGSSHASIIEEAKNRRLEREELRRRIDGATQVQAWWRGIQASRLTRTQLKELFDHNLTTITGMRCLVLMGRDEERLARWSAAAVEIGEEAMLSPFSGPNESSWLALIRQIAFLLMQSVSLQPQSSHVLAHLKLLELWTSPNAFSRVLGARGPALVQNITSYLLQRRDNLYVYLSAAIRNTPIEAKTSPSLPLIVSILTTPLQTFPSPTSSEYKISLEYLISRVLSIPLLPNRLPIPSLTHLSSRLPWSQLAVVSSILPELPLSLNLEDKVHLVANLAMFVPPRYPKLSAPALTAYLDLLTALLNALPANALEPPLEDDPKPAPVYMEVDSDSDEPRVTVVDSFVRPPAPPRLPTLDSRTRTRLQTVVSASHLNSILSVSQHKPESTRRRLFAFLQALCTIWPARKGRVLGTVAVHSAGIIRELYRGYVRGSPLGRDDDTKSLMDPIHSDAWAPLLFLTDLYTQLLLTMGDEEFFSTNPNAPRNPLSTDEVSSFSRQLLNIAFTLYWHEDQTNVQKGGVPGTSLTWEDVREKMTSCLQAIHARDSRKSFTPPGHWLVSSQIDMHTFVEAAVIEERQLQDAADTSDPDHSSSLRRRQQMSKRQLSYLSPRLGVLNNIPFAIPFDVRVAIFRHFVANDMAKRGLNDRFDYHSRTRVTVRRDDVSKDGFDRLEDSDLHGQLAITFIDQFGQPEAGIDGGGVFKEFLVSLSKEVFDANRGLWLSTKQNELYPNPHSYATESGSLRWYRFIGRILGKALYEGILIDVAFAGFFLAKWLGKQSFLDDLASLDTELYNGLIFLKHYTGNPEDLSLNFAVSEEEFGMTKTIDLIPNGSNIAVTRENRLQYIYLISHYRLSKQIKRQSEAFFEGLSDMIDPKWLRMFNQQELRILVGGVNSPVDIQDLRAHTQYGGLYSDHEPTVQAFWRVVDSFDQDQRRALLRFATSCSRPPLLGFKELVPNFSIRDAGSDENRLPTASTCVNLLKLPRYGNERTMRAKLLQAIYSGAGFDLS